MKTESRLVLGRGLLVRNLLNHLIKGTWAIVAGGRGIGKTTLLQQVAGHLIHTTRANGGIRPVAIDLSGSETADLGRALAPGPNPIVLMIDGCEALLPEPEAFMNQVLERVPKEDVPVRAVAWAGGMAWGEWAMANQPAFGRPVRYYPLIVLPPKEVRLVLLKNLPEGTPSAEVERLLHLSGGHPSLLKALLTMQEVDFDTFFEELWKAAGSADEQAVLRRLVSAGGWVFLEDLRDETGGRPAKSTLDRLATLGLIHRTLVDGAAAVRIISPLLADWARAGGMNG